MAISKKDHLKNTTTNRIYPMPNVESLNIFAKLLSGKKLRLSLDGNATTAYINIGKGHIVIPMWDVPECFFRFLVGHECAHGIWTSIEKVKEATKKHTEAGYSEMFQSFFHNVHNIIEDVRIDKMIQSKYAGLKEDYRESVKFLVNSSFNPAYKEKIENVIEESLKKILESSSDEGKSEEQKKFTESFTRFTTWANSTNYYYKTRWDKSIQADVNFSGVEKDLFEKMDTLTTEDQVYSFVDEVIEEFFDVNYMKDKARDSESLTEMLKMLLKMLLSDTGDQVNINSDGGVSLGSGNAKELDESKLTDEQKKLIEEINKLMSENINNNFRQADTSNGEITVPSNVNNGIAQTTGIFSPEKMYINSRAVANHYKNNNTLVDIKVKDNINSLVRNFELRKKAREHHLTRTSRTGLINTAKLHTYKTNSDIFLENEIKFEGDNYGFYMLLDYSGSMGEKKMNVTEYAYLMSMFFKRIGVPFKMWTVGLSIAGLRSEIAGKHFDEESSDWGGGRSPIEIFSSDMSKVDINRVYTGLKAELKSGKASLGSTPLTNTLMTARYTMDSFINKLGIDKLCIISITDGGDDMAYSDCSGIQDTKTGIFVSSESGCYYGNTIKLVKKLFGCSFVSIDIEKSGTYSAEVEYDKSYGLTSKTIKDRNEFAKFAKDLMMQLL